MLQTSAVVYVNKMYVLLSFTMIFFFALNVGFKGGGNEIIYVVSFCSNSRCSTDLTAFIFNYAKVNYIEQVLTC